MVLEINIDKNLMESDKVQYKLRSVYEKNNLLHVKFETKFGMHRGTFKKNKAYINPETGREYLYDEIDKAVKVLFDNNTNKKYSSGFTNNINQILEVGEKVVASVESPSLSAREEILAKIESNRKNKKKKNRKKKS